MCREREHCVIIFAFKIVTNHTHLALNYDDNDFPRDDSLLSAY